MHATIGRHSLEGPARPLESFGPLAPRPMKEVAVNERSGAATIRLIELAREGDRSASDELMRRVQPVLERIVRRRLGPKARRVSDTRDILQDALMGLWKQLPRLHRCDLSDVLNLGVRIAENRILDAAKKWLPPGQPLSIAGDTEKGVELPASGAGPTAEIRAKESRERAPSRVERVLGLLDPEERELIRLSQLDGLTNDDVAELLDIRRDAARMRIKRALERLRGLVSGEEAEA